MTIKKNEFSAPMPYTIEDIDKILDINEKIKKSAITSLYASLPSTCEMFTGFEQSRNFFLEHSDWNYWKTLIKYTLSKGCDFIYLLNSPRPLDIDNSNFKQQLEKLERLLNELNKIGVTKLRVASPQLQTYLGVHFKNFDILASTSLEYKTIWEYQNFIYFHPEIKQIVPSHDINKNFKILSILRKEYKNIEIELMVNEGCLQGCPNRMIHEYINIDKHTIINNDLALSSSYSKTFCNLVLNKYPFKSLIIGTNIFPWDIKKYAELGIKKFKFVGRDGYLGDFKTYINNFYMYLQGIDDLQNIKKCALNDFTHHLNNNPILKQLTVEDYKKYLPQIEYFKKYGHLCASRCGVECRYCYKCAEKIQKVLEKKQQENTKRNIPFCSFN